MVRIDNEDVVEDLLHVTYEPDSVTVEQMQATVREQGFTAALR